MPLIIAFISQKGGVGKSTLARTTAQSLSTQAMEDDNGRRRKLLVRLVDLDMAQGTSQAWHTRRVGNALPSIGDVSHFRTVEEALVDADNYDIVVIDSRGYTSEATLPIARVADMVIQPTGASLDDLEPAVRLFHELTDKGISLKRLFFALSRVITQAEIDHTRAYLSQTPYQMLDGYLSEQPGYRLALNSGLSALETPFESLNQRTDHLIQSLFNHFDILINDHGNVQN